MSVTIVLLHVVGLALLLVGSGSADRTAAIGLALTAYTLGLRHAFDADHIAAIDNTTRTLVADRRGRHPSVSGSRWGTRASSSG